MSATNARILTCVTGIVLSASVLRAADYASTQDGNWTNAATWGGGGWPAEPGDTATVAHTVTVSSDIAMIASVTVTGVGVFRFRSDTALDITQNMVMQKDASVTATHETWYAWRDHTLRGTMSVTDNVVFSPGTCGLVIRSVISGTGDIGITGGLSGNNHQRAVSLYGENTFVGDVVFTKGSSYLDVGHVNALGAKPNMVVHVEYRGGGQDSDGNRLAAINSAVFPTNVTEIILDGGAYPGRFIHGRGSIVSNTITLNGGQYRFGTSGSGIRYNRGEIVLAAGTTNTLHRSEGIGATTTYLDGVISGAGALYSLDGDGNSTTIHFRGTSNTYTGGTRIRAAAHGQSDRIRGYDGAPFGTGPVWLDGVGYAPIQLAEDCTWANDIRGQGRINTSSHCLTLTGSLSPYDTGYGTEPNKVAGQGMGEALRIDCLKFGTDATGATYRWDWNDDSHDVVGTTSLAFGAATHSLLANWLGSDAPRTGTFPIFTWTAETAPEAPDFKVSGLPSGYKGVVTLDNDAKQVLLTVGSADGVPWKTGGTQWMMVR